MQPAGPSSSQTDVLANLDDLLECSICYTPFQRPLQLSCGHSFCSVCVDRLCQHERGGGFDEIFGLANFDAFAIDMADPFIFGRFAHAANLDRAGLGGAQEAEAQNGGGIDREREVWHYEGRPRGYPIRNPMRVGEWRRFPMERRVPVAGAQERRGDVQIRCPECRRYTNVPPEGLPVNYRLQDMISRLNISKSKPSVKKDLLKCGTCDEQLQSSSFFTCKSETCAHPDNVKLCPTCAIRNHNGHQIEEIKILSESDIAVAKEAISLHTARAHQSLEQIENSFTMLAAKAKGRLGSTVRDGMNVFGNIASGLDNEIFTSLDAVQVSIDKAKSIADQYELLLNAMNESVVAVDAKFTELDKELSEFFKQTGFPMEKVKTEPLEENEILVVDMDRERQQQDDRQRQENFMGMLRRHRADERDRERERRGHREMPDGRNLMRRLRERQQNIVHRNYNRVHARMERLYRPLVQRNDEEPEEPFPRARTPPVQPLRRFQDAPIPPVPAPIVAPAPVVVPAPVVPNQNAARIRRIGDDAPAVKMEIVTPPGSPGRAEDQQGPLTGVIPRRTRRRRLVDDDPNAPGPSNNEAGEREAPMPPPPEPSREVNDDTEHMQKVDTEASSNEIH